MKILTILLTLAIFLVLALPLHAQEATKSSGATGSSQPTNKETDILNQVTDKVSKLGETLKRAYSGKVRSLGKDTFSLTADTEEVFIETNEATKFFRIRARARTETDFKALKIGDELTTIGTIDESAKTLAAREVIIKIRRHILSGKVTEVNRTTITMFSQENSSTVVDLSGSVVLKKLSPKMELVTAKITEITVGDQLIVVGFYDAGSSTLSTLRAIIVPKDLEEQMQKIATSSAKP